MVKIHIFCSFVLFSFFLTFPACAAGRLFQIRLRYGISSSGGFFKRDFFTISGSFRNSLVNLFHVLTNLFIVFSFYLRPCFTFALLYCGCTPCPASFRIRLFDTAGHFLIPCRHFCITLVVAYLIIVTYLIINIGKVIFNRIF